MSSSRYNQTNEHAPVVEVLRRILKEHNEPITVEDLTTQLIDVWDGEFPFNPYNNSCLVYKLAVGVLNCQESYDNLENKSPVYIEREQPDSDPIMLNSSLKYDILNEHAAEVEKIKLIYRDPFS
ncbi:hypothetical protein IJT10_07820 [bacterium]|nr:hypothetical protein [bacterium]